VLFALQMPMLNAQCTMHNTQCTALEKAAPGRHGEKSPAPAPPCLLDLHLQSTKGYKGGSGSAAHDPLATGNPVIKQSLKQTIKQGTRIRA
jgi:hypothetical protein